MCKSLARIFRCSTNSTPSTALTSQLRTCPRVSSSEQLRCFAAVILSCKLSPSAGRVGLASGVPGHCKPANAVSLHSLPPFGETNGLRANTHASTILTVDLDLGHFDLGRFLQFLARPGPI